MQSLYLPITAAVLSAIMLFIYLSKKRVKVRENTLYLIMLIAILADSLCVTAIFTNFYNFRNNTVLEILNKIDFMFLLSWATSLFLYTYIVLHKADSDFEKEYKFTKIISLCITAILMVIEWILDIDLIVSEKDPTLGSAIGPSVYFTIIACVMYFFISLVLIIINSKRINKKVTPVFSSLVLTVIVATIFSYNPYFICISIGLTIVNLTMYFTIENPDIQMLENVKRAEEEARKANQAKTDFLSSMSHEIRTPLNAIMGLSECILNDDSIDKAKEDEKEILNASEVLLDLVNEVLDISKIEANKMEIVNKEYDILSISETVVSIVKTRIGEKPIILSTSFSSNLPGVLLGDESKIRQIMTNLLTNAVKYTEKGKVEFIIDCENSGDISYIKITVADTGHGIEEDKIQSLFGKFIRLEEDKNSAVEGTGLGLAITDSIIKMMDGSIEVKSKYGEGSVFTVTIPQKIVDMKRRSKAEKKVIREKFPGKRVLIVDDNSINIMVEERTLELYGLEVDSVESGKECIEKCRTEKYDLILMDDMMPIMTGTEAMKILKGTPSFDTPIVILTANALEGMRDNYLKSGFDAYMSKPINKDELRNILNGFLQ